jgi:ABC-type sugar transport system substrate-binding protein
VVVAQNDAMALGAHRALCTHDPEWSSVPVLGVDGLPKVGQKLVASHQLAASVLVPPTAGIAVDLVVRWMREKKTPAPEILIAPASHPPEASLRVR